jgi:hypothetical protein
MKLKSTNTVTSIVLVVTLLIPISISVATIPNINSNTFNTVESILDIITNVNRTLIQSFDSLDVLAIPVPDNLKDSYNEGNQLANLALSLADEGENIQAGLKSIEALQKLKDTLILVGNLLPYSPTSSEELAERAISLKASIDHTYEYISRLQEIQNITYKDGYNSYDLKQNIETVKNYLRNALDKLNVWDLEGSDQELHNAKSLLSESSLNNLTKSVKVEKTRIFITDTENRLTVLRENITAISLNVSASILNASLYAISTAEENLENAKHLIEINEVDESTNEIVKSIANIKVAIRTLESVGVKIEETEVSTIQNIP